jgi:hypothetical protein
MWRMEKGVVVLDDPVTLPEGMKVQIALVAAEEHEAGVDDREETLGQKLLRHAGKATGLPRDLAENHDRYLYGTPKK